MARRRPDGVARARRVAAAAATLLAGVVVAAQPQSPSVRTTRAGMVHIARGSYLPLYRAPLPAARGAAKARVPVGAFDMDVHAVTNAEYLAFVRAHPQWQRSRIKAVFAESGYLRQWAGDLELGDQVPPASPVTDVSWFAARAYLHALGKDLPTVAQWEYAASASRTRRDASREPAFLEQLRQWYGRPAPARLPPADSGAANIYGVSGLHGLIWEWTLDFNSALVTGESRADADGDPTLFCAGAAATATDFDDYAAFMRYAFRSSLEARYTVGNLGFRGVSIIEDGR